MIINTNVVSREAVENAKDEIIRTLNYINSSGRLDYEDYCELFDTINREFLVLLKQSRKEMSARELYSAYQRICEEYNPRRKPVRCDECPLYVNCPRIGEALRTVVMCSPIVEKWAREHPERGKE